MLKDNLKRARLLADMTLDDVAQKVGVSRQTIQRYESGVIQNIPSDNIEKIAKALNVSPGMLMGWEEKTIAGTFPLNDVNRVPIIGTVRCGPGGLAYEHIDGYMMIDDSYNPAEMRGFRAEGDSMIGDGIYDGDLCLIRLQPEVENGAIAVVVIDGEEGCLKHVTTDKANSVIVLSSSNPAYPQRIFTGAETNNVRIVGKLIEVRHRF